MEIVIPPTRVGRRASMTNTPSVISIRSKDGILTTLTADVAAYGKRMFKETWTICPVGNKHPQCYAVYALVGNLKVQKSQPMLPLDMCLWWDGAKFMAEEFSK